MSERTGKRVVLVGHCRPDAAHLKTVVERAVPGAVVEAVNDEADIDAAGSDLLLVNRVLEGRFGAGSGVELIRRMAGNRGDGAAGPALMLVSNIPEAQREAVSAGAVPGFGKSDAYSAEAAARLRRAVGLEG